MKDGGFRIWGCARDVGFGCQLRVEDPGFGLLRLGCGAMIAKSNPGQLGPIPLGNKYLNVAVQEFKLSYHNMNM